MFDNKFTNKELSLLDIRDIYCTFYQINNFINENVNTRISNLSQEKVENKGSALDVIDEEEGYNDILNDVLCNQAIDNLNNIIRFSIKQCGNSLKEALEMDFLELLDFMKFELDYLEEHKDDEEEN